MSVPACAAKTRTRARILVVDDDSLWRETLCDALAASGHMVAAADNGCSCLDALACKRVDLVILDIFMPEMDGLAAIMAIKERHRGVRIIAMSGGASCLDGRCYLHVADVLGADRVLPKPVSAEALQGAISETLDAGE